MVKVNDDLVGQYVKSETGEWYGHVQSLKPYIKDDYHGCVMGILVAMVEPSGVNVKWDDHIIFGPTCSEVIGHWELTTKAEFDEKFYAALTTIREHHVE